MERPPGAEEKAWGWAMELSRQTYDRADGSLAVRCRTVKVFIKAGGYSSVHRHRECANVFSVTSGQLLLRRCRSEAPYPSVVAWKQEPGDAPFSFPAGVPHQFQAITDVELIEIYISTVNGDAGPADIQRFTKNGREIGKLMGLPFVITDHGNFPKVEFVKKP